MAPIEASSGEVVRHRLSLAGNRRLNKVMHMIAVCQARCDPRGGAYHRKKLAEGKKSRREAIRCLKRRISDAVFGALVADSGALLSHRLDTEGPRNEEFLYLRFEVWGLTRQGANTTINPLLGKESE